MPQNRPRLFLFFICGIFIINLLQAHFTELIFDEAYYWFYAQEMSWGYFDHPPMVALMIKLSSFFFDGELGVRFVSCLLSIGTLIVIWAMIDDEKKKGHIIDFFVLALSMTLLNAYGFLTLPDTPLLFFTALFLLAYKNFLDKNTFVKALVLGLTMSALMYSKYHAVLVIVFVLLSNLKLLTNKYAWMAVIVALLSYLPHFIWLYENDFVSVKYHLFDRPNAAYNFNKYTLGFFLNLVAIFGLTFPWIYRSLLRTKASDLFTKALLYLTYGFIVFFFISSFNRRVQTQWIIVISIPLAILTFNYLLKDEQTRKWVFRMGLVNIIVIAILRIGLIYEPLFPIYYETHGNKDWVKKVVAIANDNPVVFENSYRFAPMYEFYSGHPSYSLNNMNYRKNQYSIDSSEFRVQHKKVLYISPYIPERDISYKRTNGDIFYAKFIDDFASYRKLECIVDESELDDLINNNLSLKVYNPYTIDIALDKLKFGVAYLNAYKEVRDTQPINDLKPEQKISVLKANDTTNFTFSLPRTDMEDPKYFRLGISENDLPYGLNGTNIKIEQWNQ
ncbi:ArnT family glycosyltransferase [Maribacter algicola]|uniref:ArnT family glycosyltransferase n=1 Tax=Meishania litoralis TaxID=3434685 RepID=A0ACC7LJJ5_9FLAO